MKRRRARTSGTPERKRPDNMENPRPAGPSRSSFWLAYVSVLLAGALGGLLGYGLVDTGCHGSCATPKATGTLVGAALAAFGCGVVAVLVLRAMAEWRRPG